MPPGWRAHLKKRASAPQGCAKVGGVRFARGRPSGNAGGVGRAVRWMESRQVVLCLAAIAAGAAAGVAAPDVSRPLEAAITPVLALLLFATFLAVPFARIVRALADARFTGVLLVLNFAIVPLIVFGLSRVVAHDRALLVGVLLVLLTPCVDYVIVFAGLAGGARDRLLAATPVLMVLQIVLLPLYLWLMAGPDVVEAVDPHPFVEAFLLLIVAPLALAALVQAGAARWGWAARLRAGVLAAMVPLMMVVLAVVVASQMPAVVGAGGALLVVVPLFAAFVLVLAPLGAVLARLAGLARPERIAVTFSGATRNSLVVLPLALALPAPFALAPAVVVTQTLVELVAMVVMVALVPRLLRPRARPPIV
jgi:arsenite transporter